MNRTTVLAAVAVAVVGLVAVIAVVATDGFRPVFGSERCVATVDDREVRLTHEQAENAALIAAVGVRRGLPARATTIALTTAYAESGLRNLAGGRSEKVGLFGQHPSRDGGTAKQLHDPDYASNAFYDAIVSIEGYRQQDVAEVAQRAQRATSSAQYAEHEADARVLASALTGQSAAAFTCETDSAEAASADLNRRGLTSRAEVIRRDVERAFGDQFLGGFQRGGVSSGHQNGSAHYEGRAIDIFYRPINRPNKIRGWAMAQYLMANADRLEIATIIFDGQIWTSRRSGQGWRDYAVDTSGRPAATAAILEHRDHVHVDVFS